MRGGTIVSHLLPGQIEGMLPPPATTHFRRERVGGLYGYMGRASI